MKQILLAILAVSFVACATPSVLKPVELDQLPHTTLHIDFDLDLDDPIAKEYGCQLNFKNLERDQLVSFSFPANVSTGHVAVQTLPGRLRWEEIACHSHLRYEWKGKSPIFEAHSGKINYVGRLKVKQHANREMNFDLASPEGQTTKNFVQKLQEKDRKRAVSAFNGEALKF